MNPCRWLLYPLSHQGSPSMNVVMAYGACSAECGHRKLPIRAGDDSATIIHQVLNELHRGPISSRKNVKECSW